jgi:hypothetical protein
MISGILSGVRNFVYWFLWLKRPFRSKKAGGGSPERLSSEVLFKVMRPVWD